jgi:hypothetical protein
MGYRSLVVTAGTLTLLVTAALAAIVITRDVGFNPANLWTLVACGLAGVIAVRWPSKPFVVMTLVLVGAAPAVFGGFALLYLPSLALLLASLVVRPTTSRQETSADIG